jgi:hypothetical protein
MNKKIRLFACGLLAAVSLNSSSASAQSVKYELLYDDPLAFKKLFINFNLIQIEVASPTVWRPGIGAEFMLNKRLYFFGSYDRTLISMAADYATNKTQSQIEAGAIFSFASNVKMANTKVHSKSGGYSYRYKLKTKAHKQFGVHGGLNVFNTYKKSGDYYAYANTTSIFGGIAVTTSRDILVKFPDETLSRSSRAIWFLDVMAAPSISYEDATDYAAYEGSASTAAPTLFPSFKKMPVGVRMGYLKYKNWPLPMRAGFEFGSRPGIGNGAYFGLRADLSIGFMHGKTGQTADKK